MAGVFLSYDRDDGDRARQFARALEKAGHQVWWDLHVRGGAQFSKVIEEALKAADAVVVLWSRNSIESPWVRDEAAAGRDTGRLIPVTLDGTEPPLGFRQYQTIDLSRWKGRGSPPEVRTLFADVEAMATRAQPVASVPSKAAPAPARQVSRTARHFLVPGLAAIAILLLCAGGLYWKLSSRSAGPPTVAITAADDSPLSRSTAHDVLVSLGSVQGTREASYRLLDDQAAEQPDLRITVSSRQDSGQVHANVALVSPTEKAVMWSKQVAQPAGRPANFGQAIAFAAARALRCAAEEWSGEYGRLSSESRLAYLNACASLDEIGDKPEPLIASFRKITVEAPNFAPAWAHLLVAETGELSGFRPGDPSAERLRTDIARDIAAARRADPNLAEAAVAEIELLPKRAFLRSLELIQKAKAQHPDNAAVLNEEAGLLFSVGRRYEAVDDAARAAELEPFSPTMRQAYILTLVYGGGSEKAWEELAKAKQLWPDAPAIEQADYSLNLRIGDVDKAMRSSGRPIDGGLRAYLNARRDPTDANIDAFVNLANTHVLTPPQRSFVYQAFPELNRADVLYGFIERWPVEQDLLGQTYILFRPWMSKFRRDARFMRLAQRLGLLDYWQKSGQWPDFCDEPDMPYDCKKEAAKLTA